MSLISELVDALRAVADDPGRYGQGAVKSICVQAADTIGELSAKLAAENMERSSTYYRGGWISVKCEDPKQEGYYLTVCKHKINEKKWVGTSYYDHKEGWYPGGSWWSEINITHWMPLPEPPEEGETS